MKHLQQTKDDSFLFFTSDTDRLTQAEREGGLHQKVKPREEAANAALEARRGHTGVFVSAQLQDPAQNQAPALIYTNKQSGGPGGRGVNEAVRRR